jgi:excisionase family DNA binding protein
MDAETSLAQILKLQLRASLFLPPGPAFPAPILSDPLSDPPLRPPIVESITSLLKQHPSDPLFKPAEAAEYICVTENTLSVWRCTGRYNIPFIKVGRLVRYRKSALDAFLARRTRG